MDECAKCGGAMQEGFLVDHAHGGARAQLTWTPGEPEPSFWKGVKVDGGVHSVISMRCRSCGYLESYVVGPDLVD